MVKTQKKPQKVGKEAIMGSAILIGAIVLLAALFAYELYKSNNRKR